jgi:hypothetical protein
MNPYYPILKSAQQVESTTGVQTTTHGLFGMVNDELDWRPPRFDASKPVVAA